ncbi:cation-binding [Micractinium conductrix]|uniref:Cation-binding n=1 Tax=Micractinium conductrix TaxID=554055 RepID=A0A2P6VAK8_9CHLO|nr:cation-binding [Micractinium conductrix]|eukprot:PSC71130.1 cation-binding [Micractinium conductrix]
MADTISSETKERMPPNAISCCLVDHANGRTLHQARAVFAKVAANKEDAMVEKVVHTITMHCRMYNYAMMEVVLPLVEGLSEKGGELAKALKEQLQSCEGCLATVDAAKKHLDNAEFMEAMTKAKQADSELMTMAETDILPALMTEVEMSELQEAAERMEAAKIAAPLAPQAAAA